MSRRTLRTAFLLSVPILAGYVVLGIGFGILLQKAGYGWPWALAMSLTVYGGSLQYVGVNLISTGASFVTVALTSFMVQARHLFYSISMVERYKNAGKTKPYLIFGLTDEVYTVLVNRTFPEDVNEKACRFLVTLFCQVYWVAGSVIGGALGPVIPFSTEGIEFSMTALFIAAFTENWLATKNHLPALTGLVCTFVSRLVFGRDSFLIPSMLLITAVLTLMRGQAGNGLNREEGEQDEI